MLTLKMKIVFFGSSNFACVCLQKLIDSGHKIQAVITRPDKPKGRTLMLTPTPVKALALKNNLPVLQPKTLESKEFIKTLKSFDADLFIVIAYGKLLIQEVLGIPKIFSINLHASLLPKYRGAAPINWALINGEKKTGITIIKINNIVDAGDILYQEKIKINEADTIITLNDKLSKIGANSILKTIDLIQNGTFELSCQDEKKVIFAPKIKKAHGLVDWNKTASQIRNLWRGCLGWPGIFTFYKNKLMKLISIEISNVVGPPGKIIEISKQGIIVGAKENSILIKELQPESKKIMSAQEFIQGYRIKVGEFFG